MVETEVQPHRQSCTVDVESNNDLMRSSEHSIFECEAQSPSHPLRSSKKSSALMSRISMFDNQNKPIHLPVKVGSPVVNRKKSRNHRETSFSPHPNSPHAHRKERARNKSMPSPPLQCDPGGLASADESQEEFKIYEGPLLDEPSKIVPVRKSSVQERLMIFEKRNKATLNLTTQSAHVRSNSDGVFSFLNASPRHTRKSSVNVKSTDPASFVSPGINRRKAARRIPSERVPSLELQSSPIVSKGSQTARRVRPAGKGTILEHAHSFHSFNRPDDFASPSPSNQKRSWRAKLPSAHDISSLSHHSEASNATNRSDDSGEFASDALEVQPKRSWKMKRQTSTGDTTLSTRAHCDGEISQIDEVPILTNDSASSLEHVQEVRNSTDDFASPYSIQRKSNKLQDRIQKFNKAVSPQPTFLNPHYMDKLVRKESKEHERNSLSFPNRKDLASTLAYQSNDNSIITELPSNEQEARWKDKQLENTETDEIPRISLDKAAETDNENDETKKTKNFDRRGKLKARKSALVGQKDKDKDAVFANDLIHDEDVGSHVLPEFPKEKADEKIIITALRKNFVFEEMEENDIEKLVTAMEEIKVSKGTKIIKQGDEGDYFYVIARGDVAFFVDDRKVGAAGPGNAFGDLALLYKCPRAATVRAEAEPTTLFRIDQKTFRYMTQSQIKKSEEQKKTLLKEIPFLSTLGADDISRLCSVMKPVLFSTGDYIVRKGDNGSSFFIIQDGKVRLTEIFVGGTSYEDISLGIGDYFGEDALISDEPRAANVVALTKGSAFSIDRATVWKVLGDFASLISKAQDRQRLVRLLNIFLLSSINFPDSFVHLGVNENIPRCRPDSCRLRPSRETLH